MLKVIGFAALIVAIIIVATVVWMIVWQWVVPDIFAGAVEHGILPATISFVQALKLSILLTVFGIAGSRNK